MTITSRQSKAARHHDDVPRRPPAATAGATPPPGRAGQEIRHRRRQGNEDGAWSSIFPTQQQTRSQSTVLLKKILAVAISNIAYLRALLPESAFSERTITTSTAASIDSTNPHTTCKNTSTHLKILRDDSPSAAQLIKWLRGCFDALDKRFLRCLILGVCAESNENNHSKSNIETLETYTFEFKYSQAGSGSSSVANDGTNSSCGTVFTSSGANISTFELYRNNSKIISEPVDTFSSATRVADSIAVQTATTRMLRTLIVLTQALEELPVDRKLHLTMRLMYYDAFTPAEYQPPGFENIEESFKFDFETVTVKAGEVSTSFHNMQCKVKTDKEYFDENDSQNLILDNSQNNSIHPNLKSDAITSHIQLIRGRDVINASILVKEYKLSSKDSKDIINDLLQHNLILETRYKGRYTVNIDAISQYERKKQMPCATNEKRKPNIDDFEISNSQPEPKSSSFADGMKADMRREI